MAAGDVHGEIGRPAASRTAGSARARERRCIVSRVSGDAAALIRFALAPDATVVPDIKETLPGRGCWIAANRAYVTRAVEQRLFARAFKADCRADAALPDLVERLLRDDALALLALGRKAGQIALGEAQVVAAARDMPLAAVIHAADGAQNGLKKVKSALAGAGRWDTTPVVRTFTGAELSLALGLPNVIHAGLPAGRLGMAFAMKARKLAAFRGDGGEYAADFTSDRPAGPVDHGQASGSWTE